jgi:hypothetical protein
MTPWEIHGQGLTNCNCAYGCPCQFNAPPTDGTCEAILSHEIHRGHFGDVKLDGLRVAIAVKWPGPIHQGNGEMQIIIDARATAAQRAALETILTGGETDEMATMWWVFSAMSPTKHETLFRDISFEVDQDARTGRVAAEGVFEMTAEPIRNPVTGAEHRARIDLTHGFEYRLAEMGSGTIRTSGMIKLPKNSGTYAQFNEIHLSNSGLLNAAA